MDTKKLRESLLELHEEKVRIAAAIDHLEAALVLMEAPAHDGQDCAKSIKIVPPFAMADADPRTKPRSYIDDSEYLIRQAGHALHARDLAEGASTLRHSEVKRGAMESTITRHISDLGPRARLTKCAPSTYDLSDWNKTLSIQEVVRNAS